MDRDAVLAALQNPMDLPQEFKAWLLKYIEVNPPSLPAAQMLGYKPTADAASLFLQTFVNVKDPRYGAKGDGVTDDSAAINAAISAARTLAMTPANGNRSVKVVLPPGDYLCKSTVGHTETSTIILSPISISGPGTLIADPALGANPLLKLANTGADSGWFYLSVSDLHLKGSLGHTGDLLLIQSDSPSHTFSDFQLENIVCDPVYGQGIHIKGNVFQFSIRNPIVLSANRGVGEDSAGDLIKIETNGTVNPQQWTILDAETQGGNIGLNVADPCDGKIIGGAYLSARNEGINFACHGGCVVGAHVESNGRRLPGTMAGLKITGWGTVINVSNAIGDSNQLYGVWAYNDIGSTIPITVLGADFSSAPAGSAYLKADGPGSGATIITDVAPTQTVVAGSHVTVIRPQDKSDPLKRTGIIAASIQRVQANSNALAALASGRLSLYAIYLPSGTDITNIAFMSGGTAAVSPTNQWFALYDKNLNKIAVTADGTTGAWVANSFKSLALSAPYTTTYDGIYYLGIMVAAATVPTLMGASVTSNVLMGSIPRLAFATTSIGLTNPLSAPATAVFSAAQAFHPYAEVS